MKDKNPTIDEIHSVVTWIVETREKLGISEGMDELNDGCPVCKTLEIPDYNYCFNCGRKLR